MEMFQRIQREIVGIGLKILNSGLVVGTWGNVSAKIAEKDLVAISPSGMSYDLLQPEDVVIVDMSGNVVVGRRKPSIETQMHLAIYRARNDVNAVVHTHSPSATAMAIARKSIPGAVEDLVQIVGGKVDVSEYALPGTIDLGLNVVKALGNKNAVLLANHGMLGVGKDLEEALKVCHVVEKAAKTTILAQLMGGAVELSEADINSMREFFVSSYGQ